MHNNYQDHLFRTGNEYIYKIQTNRSCVIPLSKKVFMKLSTDLLHETALYVKNYYDAEFSVDFTFHNYNRAVTIVRHCTTLGVQMNLKKEESKTLHLAAWFLETGYSRDYDNYQSASVTIANAYLEEKGVDEDVTKSIEELILSTRVPEQPVTLMAQVLCDARMYYLAEKNLLLHIENLRTERLAVCKKEYSDKEWLLENINTTNNYFYFTSAAKELLEKKKQKQKSLLQNHSENEVTAEEGKNDPTPALNEGEKMFVPLLEDIKTERGVETFFRITERRHIELSTKVHDKASLLISVNAIVLSIVLSVLVTKLEENKFLLFPTFLLVVTCVSTIVLAIISTRPRFLGKKNQVVDHEFNILFFGDFSKLSLAEFKKKMKETYKNKNELYDSLSRDIYYQGIILVWKYRYINVAYNLFMYGFVITILAFMIAFVIKTT